MNQQNIAPSLQKNIKEGHKNPDRAALLIARILLRDIWAQVNQHKQENIHQMDPLERVAVVALRSEGKQKGIAKKAQLDEFLPTIKLLIEAHSGKQIDAIVSPKFKEMVARAVLEILWAIEEKAGNHELAHHIHNATNPVHLLENRIRIALLDKGIIYANPRSNTFKDGSSVWVGHKTEAKFSKKAATTPNIYVRVSWKKQGVTTLAEWESIHTGNMSDMIVVDKKNIRIQQQPRISNAGRILTSRTFLQKPNTVGEVSGVTTLPVASFTGWTAYRITGDQWTLSVCISHATGENNSFANSGELYSLESTALCIEKGRIIVLEKNGNKKMYNPKVIKSVWVKKGEKGKEGLYFIDWRERKRKLILENETVIIKNITLDEEDFFLEKK